MNNHERNVTHFPHLVFLVYFPHTSFGISCDIGSGLIATSLAGDVGVYKRKSIFLVNLHFRKPAPKLTSLETMVSRCPPPHPTVRQQHHFSLYNENANLEHSTPLRMWRCHCVILIFGIRFPWSMHRSLFFCRTLCKHKMLCHKKSHLCKMHLHDTTLLQRNTLF